MWCACLVRVILEAVRKDSAVPYDATFASQIALVHVIETASVTFPVSHTCSNQAHSIFKCDWMKFGDGNIKLTSLCGVGFFAMWAGWTYFVNDSWSSATLFTLLVSSLILGASRRLLSSIVWSCVLKNRYAGAVETCFSCCRRWIVIDVHCRCCEKLRSQTWRTNNSILYILTFNSFS